MNSRRHPLLDERHDTIPREHDLFNINGPSLIEVPDWLPDARARFHLYFAHHLGHTIRVAFADQITGPWRVHPAGVLDVAATPATGLNPHVASPDVHVDEENQRLVMYFHCPVDEQVGGHLPCWEVRGDQKTLIATSTTGLDFTVTDPTHAVSNSYLRMVRWGNEWLGMAMHSQLVRSTDGVQGFDVGPDLFGADPLRHNALLVDGDDLHIWFTRLFDAPERIYHSTVPLHGDWSTWRPSEPVEVLRPVEPWEGADLAVQPSQIGPAFVPEHALRDPFVFDVDDERWLFYAGAGESVLGAVRLGPTSP